MSTDQSHWHGYRSGIDWLKANVALLPLITAAGYAALVFADQRYDVRYVQSAALSQAVQTIQLSSNEQEINRLEIQLQIAYRRLNAVAADQMMHAEILDEIRVLEAAKAAAERRRQALIKGVP